MKKEAFFQVCERTLYAAVRGRTVMDRLVLDYEDDSIESIDTILPRVFDFDPPVEVRIGTHTYTWKEVENLFTEWCHRVDISMDRLSELCPTDKALERRLRTLAAKHHYRLSKAPGGYHLLDGNNVLCGGADGTDLQEIGEYLGVPG